MTVKTRQMTFTVFICRINMSHDLFPKPRLQMILVPESCTRKLWIFFRKEIMDENL